MPWSVSERDEIVKALAVTCEVTGTSLSGPAKTFMLVQLEAHPAADVLRGLLRCAHEVKGRLALADVVKAISFVDRRALSDGRAARSAYLTKLRGCALVERIAWNDADPESVRRELEAKGYRFTETPKQVRALPHWQETEKD
jgi:hypothetical protein